MILTEKIELSAGKTVVFGNGADEIGCDRGVVWITGEAWDRDILLKAGDTAWGMENRSVCVQALSGASIRVERMPEGERKGRMLRPLFSPSLERLRTWTFKVREAFGLAGGEAARS